MLTFDTIKGGLVSYIFGIIVEILYNIIFYTKFGCLGLFFIFIIWIIYCDGEKHHGLDGQKNIFFNLVSGLNLINLLANYTINEIKDKNGNFSIGLGIGAILYFFATYSGYIVSVLVISGISVMIYYLQIGIQKLDELKAKKRN